MNFPRAAFSLLAVSLLCACAAPSGREAVAQADARAANDPGKPLILQAEHPYDLAELKRALVPGNATIRGVVTIKPLDAQGRPSIFAPGGRVPVRNPTVLLFPVTDYLNAWYQLRAKTESPIRMPFARRDPRKKYVVLHDEVFKFRMEAQGDEYGRFRFEKMKPGRYFLTTVATQNFDRNVQVHKGSAYDGYGRVDYYGNEVSREYREVRVEQFVDIKSDGEVAAVALHEGG